MKKTHSANIGGTVFQVEEDAYEQLQAYLQSIETHFRSYPDVADIVADIEGRIAEQLLQRELAPQVVQMSDVERVIASMGRIEQFAEAASGTGPAAETAPAAGQMLPSEGRKLYRDPDHKIIAGVAAGLASYLGLPRLLVRLLLLLLLVLFGTSLVVYLLCWALVPMAASATDKLQMRGRPLTLASIDQRVRDDIASIPPATRGAAAQGITAAGALIHLVVVTIARALKWAAGVFVVGGATLGVLFLTVLLVVALVNPGAAPLDPAFVGFFALFGAWQHVFKVLLFLVVAIPLAVVIATGLRLFWGVNRLNTRGLAGLLGMWVVSLLAAAAIWSSCYPELDRYWDEYPVTAEARETLDGIRTVVLAESPLSDEQSKALLATLVVESRRRREQDQFRNHAFIYARGDPRSQLEFEEQRLKARNASDRRIVESARSYLDAKQLAGLQDAMAEHSTRMQAHLKAWREQLERLAL